MTFDDLNINTPLRNAIEDMGYIYPTPIQKEVFPILMSGKDIVGVAQTGTGKTLAYILPILRQMKYSEQKHPRVLILVPTRELVAQVVNEINAAAKYMTIRVAGVYGGTNINTQKHLVLAGLDILVATPGRLKDLTLDGSLKLKNIKQLVIDEVDEMLNLGFRHQLTDVMDLIPEKRQNLMFSATLSEDIDQLISTFFYKPEKIEIAASGTPLEKIIQEAYHVPNFFTKVNLLEHLLNNHDDMSKVLVFTGNKRLADKLYEKITPIFGKEVGVIHSNKSQNQRFGSIDQFEKGELRILIATDIIARGLDIQDVTHVVNFDTPTTANNYMHRIGRTGRADRNGTAITFINEAEQVHQMEIETLMNQIIPLKDLPEDVEISTIFTDDEKPQFLGDKNYLQQHSLKDSGGAFQEKSAKNSKINLGGSYRKKIKEKYKKPQTRSSSSKKKK